MKATETLPLGIGGYSNLQACKILIKVTNSSPQKSLHVDATYLLSRGGDG